MSWQPGGAWLQHRKALQHLVNNVFRAINKLLHDAANVPRPVGKAP
jgi:hypothetical protein